MRAGLEYIERMVQFYKTHKDDKIAPPLGTQFSNKSF